MFATKGSGLFAPGRAARLRGLAVALFLAATLLSALPAGAQASTVVAPSVTLTSTAATATGVTYEVDFMPSTSLAANSGTVTVALPSGTVIPDQAITVRDVTFGSTLGVTGTPTLSDGGASATWTLGNFAVDAGDTIELEITGVTNPLAQTGQAMVSTSGDTTPVATSTFTLTAPGSVGSPSVAASSTGEGATGVTYTVDETTSATGALAAQHGTFTVALPTGTVIPAQGIAVSDLTTGEQFTGVFGGTGTPTFSNGQATATWTINHYPITAGHVIQLTIPDVTNASSAGGSVALSTSSDLVPSSTPITLSPASSVGSPSVSLSSAAEGVLGVTYLVDLTTSSTGGLAASEGTFTVGLPAGTVIPNTGIDVRDLTTGRDLGTTCATSITDSGATATWTVCNPVTAGQRIELVVTGVTNASSAGGSVAVSSSSDTVPASTAIALTAGGSVSGVNVALSNQSTSATGVNYSVDFQTSATGQLTADNGTITVTAPAGTDFSGAGIVIRDLTTNTNLGSSCGTTLGGANNTVTWTACSGIGANQRLELVISNVTNPGAASNTDTLSVATSSDGPAASPAYEIGSSVTPPTAGPTAVLSSTAAGATGVAYSVIFTTSSTGALAGGSGTITLNAPAGTVLPNQALQVFDMTTGQSLAATSSPGSSGHAETYTVNTSIPASHEIRLVATGVHNPASPVSGATITVSTSSQSGAATNAFNIVAAGSVGSPTVSLSSAAASVSNVTYTVGFTTSATGALAQNAGTITLSAPSGTTFPNGSIDVFDVTTNEDLGGTSNSGTTGNVLTWQVGNAIPAGDQVRLTIRGVTNPAAGSSDSISVSTSSDTTAANTSAYAIGSATSVSSPTVAMSSAAAGATGVTYTVGFTTSLSGGLSQNDGTITLGAPSGTTFPDESVDVFDVTTGEDLGATFASGTTGGTATWQTRTPIPGGDQIRLTIPGVTNPAAASGDAISVSTSSDAAAVDTNSYDIDADQSLGAPSLGMTSTQAGGSGVTYVVGLTTSSTGGLAANQGTVTVTAPSGTTIPNETIDVFDQTGDYDLGSTHPSGTTGNAATWTIAAPIAAGHRIRLTIPGVTNPSGGNYQLQVSTSSDTGASTPLYTIGTTTAVSSPTVTLSNYAEETTNTTYTIGFTATTALPSGGTITAAGPSGTVFSSGAVTVDDVTSSTSTSSANTALSGGGETATWTTSSAIAAGDQVQITATGVTNPVGGTYELDLSTSADTAIAQTPSYVVTRPSYLLTVSDAGTGTGSVTSGDGNINCGATCSFTYSEGTPVVLTATPATGSGFTGWSGGGCSGTGTCVVSMSQTESVTATFTTLPEETLSISFAGTGGGTIGDGGSLSCTSSCAPQYLQGTMVTLTATPAIGSVFTGWSGSGCSGTGTCVVAMSAAESVTATFTMQNFTLNVSPAGAGSGTVTSGDGDINCGATCSFSYPAQIQVTLTASPGAHSTFAGWSGGGCSGTGTCVVTMSQAQAVTATFDVQTFLLTVAGGGNGSGTITSLDGGINCGSTCSASYQYNTQVTLSAAPATGSTFTGWSGGGCSGTGTCVVTLSQAQSVTAIFTLQTFLLSASSAGTGSGTVTSQDGGIDCGSTCSASYNYGTQVTLTATPAPIGSIFAGWSGGGCSGTGTCVVTVDSAQSVTATFNLQNYTLNVSTAGTGSGSVTSNDGNIDCGSTCSFSYPANTQVTLSATTAPIGSAFAGWSGGGCSGTGTCVVTLSQAQSVTATFNTQSWMLSVSQAGTGSGSVTSSDGNIDCGSTCSSSYPANTQVTLSAAPAVGSTFIGWAGVTCPGAGACVVTMSQARSVAAVFSSEKFALTVSEGGTGAGTVTSGDGDIACEPSCSANYPYGSQVLLTASPATGSTFTGWSGGGCLGTGTCLVTMTQAQGVTAAFSTGTGTGGGGTNETLSVTKHGSGSGTVTSAPSAIDCGASCAASFAAGTKVTLSATAAAGSSFAGWSGAGCSGTHGCTVTMSAARSVTATFNTVSTSPRCTLTAKRTSVVASGHKHQSKTGAGAITLVVQCSQSMTVTIHTTVTELRGHKPGRSASKVFHLATAHVAITGGVAKLVTIKVPASLVRALEQKVRETAAFTMTGAATSGPVAVTATVKALKV